jgi:hypothetical protein
MYIFNDRVANDSQYAVMKDTEDDIPGKFLEDLERKLKIDIIRLDNDDIEFDLVGIDASIANALRRIMLAEVPTLAIESVWIAINTSIIQDEVLSHRIGLIPIAADPNQFEYVVDEEETGDYTYNGFMLIIILFKYLISLLLSLLLSLLSLSSLLLLLLLSSPP